MKDITVLFVLVDEFCKIYKAWEKNKLIDSSRKRIRTGKLSLSESLTIMIYFHLSGYKDFKNYYLYEILRVQKDKFKDLLSYGRFVNLMPKLLLPLSLMMQYLRGEETNSYIIDSSALRVCHNRRIFKNKVFKGLAERSKSTMVWFYGFKLHMVINNKGEIMAVKITKGNVDDRSPLHALTKNLKGKIFADRGYISKNLFNDLYKRGLKIISGIRKTMKNYLIDIDEKFAHRKRFLIETIFGKLKTSANLDHTRHKSPTNFIVNVLACLASYSLSLKLKSIAIIPS